MAAASRKYNPGFLTDDELVASFCVRGQEFDSMIEMLRECDGSANPHRMVIGPRGSGKTSLLLRVAAEIRRDASLSSRFFPVVFAEESYEIASAGEFWLECLARLADHAPPQGDAPDLRRAVEELRALRDDRTLGERCLGALLDFADREGKRLVLIVENLNMTIGDMADRDAEWRLRHTLQTEPRIVLLASATSRFDGIDDPDRALFDLFRLVFLRPLDTEECAVLWERVSGRRRAPETIEALRILTGGSPRLIAILARFGGSLSFRELMAELLDLVDDHTEYFRSHLEALAPQERRVYLALADLWKPATAREVADRARLETSKCSAHLARLVERGAVEVAGGGARRKQYYLTERLYNIYYLLRRSRGREPFVEALVRFMEAWYSPRELTRIGVGLAKGDDSTVEGAWLRDGVLEHLMKSPVLEGLREELIAAVHEGISGDPARAPVLSRIAGAATLGVVLPPDARDRAGESAPKSGVVAAARALLDEADGLAERSRSGEAIVNCDEIVRRFADSDAPAVLALVADALVLKGDLLAGWDPPEDPWSRVEQAMREVSRTGAQTFSEIVWLGLGGTGAGSERAPEALAAYDELLKRFGGSADPVLSDRIATALLRKAAACLALERPEEALASLEDAAMRFGDADAEGLREAASGARYMMGFALLALDRAEDALASLDEAVRLFRKEDVPEAARVLSWVHLSRGFALARLGRTEEALAPWDAAIGLFGNSKIPLFSEMAAVTLVQKAGVLAGFDRVGEALGAYDEALLRYGKTESPAFPLVEATALAGRGHMLARSGRLEEALVAHEGAIDRFAAAGAPAYPELAGALFDKGALLEGLDRHEEALAAYDDLLGRFGKADAPALAETLAGSLLQKGFVLDRLMRPEEAFAALDEAASRFRDRDSAELVELAAKALVKKGDMLRAMNRLGDALVANDEVVRRFGERSDPGLHVPLVAALVGRGFALRGLDRHVEALAAFNDATERTGKDNSPEAPQMSALAHVGRALALRALGRPEDALTGFDEAARLFGESGDPGTGEASGAALLEKAGLELESGRYAAAIETAGRVLDRSLTLSARTRARAHLTRTRAALASGNPALCTHDIEGMLALLPDLGPLPVDVVHMLMAFSIDAGVERALELIESSPSATALLPLRTALEREIGIETRVAREVEEVARDIREGLAKMRQDAEAGRGGVRAPPTASMSR